MRVELTGFPGELEVGWGRRGSHESQQGFWSEGLAAVVGCDQVVRLWLNF